jgi:hypothetical protein
MNEERNGDPPVPRHGIPLEARGDMQPLLLIDGPRKKVETRMSRHDDHAPDAKEGVRQPNW